MIKKRFKNKQKYKKTKPVVIKKHHAKPYRKSHYVSLTILIVLLLSLIGYVIVYREDVSNATRSASNYVGSLFNRKNTISTIYSSYGFSVSYDTEKYYSGAIETTSGGLYFGNELQTKRPYEQVRFSSSKILDTSNIGSITMQYYPRVNVTSVNDSVLQQLETEVVKGNSDSKTTIISKLREDNVDIDGNKFIKTEWSINTKALNSNLLELYITTYKGRLNSNAFIIKIAKGTNKSNDHNDIINSLKFSAKTVVFQNKLEPSVENYSNSSKLLNSLFFTSIAKAQSVQSDGTEKIAAKYSPAVVQIWNFYCTDINYRGKPYLNNVCGATRGSGFFISSDGYIATNGHVVSSDSKDIIISNALLYAYLGDTTYLNLLIQESGVTEADLLKYSSVNERLDFLIDKFYNINNTIFTSANKVLNLLVLLNEKTPNVNELRSLSVKRQEYPEQDSIKRAEVKAIDFRFFDGVIQWRASDVAIIKIDGQNYPVVKTGNIHGLTQGAQLTILGYPAQASNNSIVDDTISKATLTSGKVSSIKNAKGSNKVLIETDTTIGKGNSGGPAFDSVGMVIGISTYTSDGAGTGGGTFNYIRDIKDVIDVASKGSINLDVTSTTQTKWEEGLNYFYRARYSKAVKEFQEVKKIYPQHSKVEEFITSANEKIASGQDIKDFPFPIVSVSASVLLIGLVIVVFIILNHKKKHKAYLNHVLSNGGETPFVNNIKSVTLNSGSLVDSTKPKSNNNPEDSTNMIDSVDKTEDNTTENNPNQSSSLS